VFRIQGTFHWVSDGRAETQNLKKCRNLSLERIYNRHLGYVTLRCVKLIPNVINEGHEQECCCVGRIYLHLTATQSERQLALEINKIGEYLR